MLQEECGEVTNEEREMRDKLEQDIEALEIFIDKFEGFSKELAMKVEYATAELEMLTKQTVTLTVKYGLDPSTVPPKELFEIFFTFGKEFS